MILRCFYPSDLNRRWDTYISRGPKNRAELESASELILGHFTSSTFLPSIIAGGLTPDTNKERATNDGLPSDDRSVYLLTTFDRFYLDRAVKSHGGEPLVIEVKVLRAALTADEEWLAPIELPITDSLDALYKTMCGGACKHLGPVPPRQILSIRRTDGRILMGKDTE